MLNRLITILVIFLMALKIISGCGDDQTVRQQSLDAAERVLTFAVFGNTGRVTDDGRIFSQLITAMNADDTIDFAVHLGNRLPDGIPSAGVRSLLALTDNVQDSLSCPVYPVAGTNDVFDFTSDVAYSDRYGPLWYDFHRAGTHFIVLDTEDDAYRYGFGLKANMSDGQIGWLLDVLENNNNKEPVVVFMHRPLWIDSPELWKEELLPILKIAGVRLVVTAFDGGLIDWGAIEGIPVVSTGCTGPVEDAAPGLFPHVLLVTVSNGDIAFRVLHPDGDNEEGVALTAKMTAKIGKLADSFDLAPLRCDNTWNIHEPLTFTLDNIFDEPVHGCIEFSPLEETHWQIEPPEREFTVQPGVTSILHMGIGCRPPDMSPVPRYHAEVFLGETQVFMIDKKIEMAVPKQRTGEVVPIKADIAEVLPYAFDGSTLRIPVRIEQMDTCGRIILYRDLESDIPECLYVAPLQDFSLGVNEFIWNGTDMKGEPVQPGELDYRLFIYNKEAPATWVADGPPNVEGTFTIERTVNGLRATTHDEDELLTYRIGTSMLRPEPDSRLRLDDVLDGSDLTGFAADAERDRLFLGTDAGIVCVYLRRGELTVDRTFGDNGYLRFIEYRGRKSGRPVYFNGNVYVGIGGGEGNNPLILVLDGLNGNVLSTMSLEAYYGEHEAPPAVTVTGRGILCAHPDEDRVVMIAHYGEVLWINDAGDRAGDRDVDGRSHTYGIGLDGDGFSYVNTPGYSARCGVIGPDGTALFRVILVQLPGLRVSDVASMIEGRDTDGLYFIVRNGERPYVFHVPYTVKTGVIVDVASLDNAE